MGPRIREDKGGRRWVPVSMVTLGGKPRLFWLIRFFLWWKRMAFSSVDVSPLDCHGFGEGTDDAEKEFKGTLGGFFRA